VGALAALLESGGALLLLVGAYLPWVVTFFIVGDIPTRGVETPGGRALPLLALAVLALVVLTPVVMRRQTRKVPSVHLAIALLGVVLIGRAASHIVETERNLRRARARLAASAFSTPEVRVRYASGLYLTAAAGAAMAAGAILAGSQERSSSR
jgi:hypothetical protein